MLIPSCLCVPQCSVMAMCIAGELGPSLDNVFIPFELVTVGYFLLHARVIVVVVFCVYPTVRFVPLPMTHLRPVIGTLTMRVVANFLTYLPCFRLSRYIYILFLLVLSAPLWALRPLPTFCFSFVVLVTIVIISFALC
uniref:Uncharacterized protein TCIL3000_3_900 n=1 Tax=Trypanosoma congolense (strain IL3000) TaxID=1068625 RepID=G0UJW0_TRYCI|nr:unnamed protein product [Trypanosoma congolense IL3000]